MSSLFVSYSRSDLPQVLPLAETLTAQGCSVWRDQHSLYSGQRWPKVIGEAIAAQEALLLVWSQHAAQSHYVEFEWSTALALRKPVLLCHLDATPLPPSLQGLHSIPAQAEAQTVAQLLAALPTLTRPVEPARQQEVLAALPVTAPTTPEALTQTLRSRFIQPGWQVGGNVYQATEMTITIGTSTTSTTPTRGWLERWYAWAALGVAVLTVLSLALDVPNKVQDLLYGPPATRTVLQSLAGVIWDEYHQVLPDVEVFVPELQMSTRTDARGTFTLKVSTIPQRPVELVASKPGYATRRVDATMGTTNVQFMLRRP